MSKPTVAARRASTAQLIQRLSSPASVSPPPPPALPPPSPPSTSIYPESKRINKEMKGLFKSKPRTPVDIVRQTRDLLNYASRGSDIIRESKREEKVCLFLMNLLF